MPKLQCNPNEVNNGSNDINITTETLDFDDVIEDCNALVPGSKVTKQCYNKVSKELKKQIVESLASGESTRKSLAETFNLPYGTVSSVYRRFTKTFEEKNEDLKHPALSDEQINFLSHLHAQDGVYTLKQMRKMFEIKYKQHVPLSVLKQYISALPSSMEMKPKTFAPPMTLELMEGLRMYRDFFLALVDCGRMLVYFDETSYACKDGSRCNTVMASMTKNELLLIKTFPGPATEASLLEYVAELFTQLQSRNIHDVVLIMDKAESYHNDVIREATRSAGHDLLFIEPYCLFLNPVEVMFFQLNNMLKSQPSEIDFQDLQNMISTTVGPEHCAKYHQHMLDTISSCLTTD